MFLFTRLCFKLRAALMAYTPPPSLCWAPKLLDESALAFETVFSSRVVLLRITARA
jgi:hypothetical protein